MTNVNKNIGEPTNEMLATFHLSYNGVYENIPKAILALKEYGLFPLMTIKVLMSELNISLMEAKATVMKSKVYHASWF